MPDHAVDAVLEIFAWVGFGFGALLALVAVVIHLADGTWLPVQAMIEDGEHGRIARWFDADGGVGVAHLSHEQDRALEGKDVADVYYRRNGDGRMRLTKGSPLVRGFRLLAVGLVSLGVVALVASWIVLFARG